MSGMTIGADGETTNTVTLENVEEVRTRKVGQSGQVYVGEGYGGQEILFAFRVQEQDGENNDTDAEDSES